jgi:Protein of unknown function (DUF2752)
MSRRSGTFLLVELAVSAPAAAPLLRTRVWRALGVALVWGFAGMPVLFGHARCLFAAVVRYPCPGCGMTRAVWLLAHGDVAGSVRMHPLAVPAVLATGGLALATVWATVRSGSPLHLWGTKLGRGAIVVLAVVEVLAVMLWGVRAMGFLGGPVPV